MTIEGTENVAEGETFTATVRPDKGYHLPYAISVVMNGRPLRADEYTYDRNTGKIEIKNVTGPLSISVKGVQEGYFEVVLNLSNLSSDPASFEPQAKDTKIELTLKPSSGYELPSGVTVKMGDATLGRRYGLRLRPLYRQVHAGEDHRYAGNHGERIPYPRARAGTRANPDYLYRDASGRGGGYDLRVWVHYRYGG